MIKLSKKAEYALRAVAAMGRQHSTAPFQIQDLASSLQIPPKFLEQILLQLKKGGILESKRGVGGGYRFQRSVDRITLGEVLTLVDGAEELPDCSRPRGGSCICGVPGGCGVGSFFAETQSLLAETFRQTTIADLLTRERRPEEVSYEI